MNTAEYALPVNRQAEERFHAPLDYREASNRRKTVVIFVLFLVVLAQIGVITKLATAPRDAYFAVQTPNGETYVISNPKQKLDIRSDVLAYEAVRMSLAGFARSYFERTAVTARKDYEHARWFLPDNLLAGYDETALGDKGWIHALETHQLPESHAQIDTIEMREADIAKEPYQARIYLTRTNLTSSEVVHTIANVTFVVRPDIWIEKHLTRYAYYNALGVLIVKPIEESIDFRK